ncbi:MAG: hypothetical protein MUO26_02695 [Methanotrichaceae archaeon]|nr:hypothetical protein [Methanotrichaceae archaeon]
MLEEMLNLLLIEMADIEDGLEEGLEALRHIGKLSYELEQHIRLVMSDISQWIDECTLAVESSPILLRRMQVHLGRLGRLLIFIEELQQN